MAEHRFGNNGFDYRAAEPGWPMLPGEEVAFDHVPSEAELLDAFPGRAAALAAIVPVHYVRKLTIIERLDAAGKLADADAALQASLLLRMKWEAAPPLIPHNHADVVAFMQAIGADVAVILAEETI